MRIQDSARHLKEADKILKSEFIKRCTEKIKNKKEFYRDRCKLVEGPELYRNQGKWEVLEDVMERLFEETRLVLEKEVGASAFTNKI